MYELTVYIVFPLVILSTIALIYALIRVIFVTSEEDSKDKSENIKVVWKKEKHDKVLKAPRYITCSSCGGSGYSSLSQRNLLPDKHMGKVGSKSSKNLCPVCGGRGRVYDNNRISADGSGCLLIMTILFLSFFLFCILVVV